MWVGVAGCFSWPNHHKKFVKFSVDFWPKKEKNEGDNNW